MSKNISDLTNIIFTHYPNVRKVYRNLVSIKDVPISMTQLTCLSIVAEKGMLIMTKLAEQLNMSNQQLTKVVDALVEFDMVERITDENNRRKIYARCTKKGEQLICKLRSEIENKLGYILRKKSADELDKLYECIAHVASYFES